MWRLGWLSGDCLGLVSKTRNYGGLLYCSHFVFALGPALKIGGHVVLQAINEGQTSLIPLPYWGVMNLPIYQSFTRTCAFSSADAIGYCGDGGYGVGLV